MHSQDWNGTPLPDPVPKANSSASNGPYPITRPGTAKPGKIEETFQTSISPVSWWDFITHKQVDFSQWANEVTVNQVTDPPNIGTHCTMCAAQFVRDDAHPRGHGPFIPPKHHLETSLRPMGGRPKNDRKLFMGMASLAMPTDTKKLPSGRKSSNGIPLAK